MSYEKLINGETAKETRDKINNNFDLLYKYMSNQFIDSKCASFVETDWVFDSNKKCYTFTITIEYLGDDYIPFTVYSYDEQVSDSQTIHCDMFRDYINKTLILYSDIPFKGWVARL